MSVTLDAHLDGWPHILGPLYPTRPPTYGANPHQPSPELPSRFEGMAALKGGWTPKAERVRKRSSRRQRRRR